MLPVTDQNKHQNEKQKEQQKEQQKEPQGEQQAEQQKEPQTKPQKEQQAEQQKGLQSEQQAEQQKGLQSEQQAEQQPKQSGKQRGVSRGVIGRLATVLILLALGLWIWWGNVTVKTTGIEVVSPAIPKAFDGFMIAQVSDVHNAMFGKDNQALVKIIREAQPDLIALTGDLVDCNRTDIGRAVRLARELVQIAPCYYVTGNHEAWLNGAYGELEEALLACGVVILHNQGAVLERNGEKIFLAGIDDPDFAGTGDGLFDLSAGKIAAEIEKARSEIHAAEAYAVGEEYAVGEAYAVGEEYVVEEEYAAREDSAAEEYAVGEEGRYLILLSHRPEVFETYVREKIPLVLSGHAHGGQFRLPFIGGLIAPNQGLFPKYDSGVYREQGTVMVVSRGVGNSVIPVRVNNRPEVVLVTLRAGKAQR